MPEFVDFASFRAAAFAIVTLTTVGAWRHEQSMINREGTPSRRILWPSCWLLIGAAYASMSLAIAFDLAGTFGGIGREYAREGDWYESRRPIQAAAVGVLSATWIAGLAVGIWRVPQRRRRYLASVLLCTTLTCFALLRVVSFHYVDKVLSRSQIADTPVGTLIELAAIVAAIIFTFVASHRPLPDPEPLAGEAASSGDIEKVGGER